MALAVASVALVTVVNYGLREVAPVVSSGIVYLLAVLLVSIRAGRSMGLFTAVLSAVAFNFFHIFPTGRLAVADAENWIVLLVFLVAAVVTSALVDSAHSRAVEAEQRRREADLSFDMARTLLGGSSVEASLAAAGDVIARALGLGSATVEAGWSDSDEARKAVPLLFEGARVGTVLIPRETDEAVVEALRDRVLPALATLVAAARRREELESQVIETMALKRSNEVQRSLLRSVSHDLRSPLTAITAAGDGLLSEQLSDESRRELGAVVASESARLSRLVDNLLDLSRLQAGRAEPRRDLCSVEEVVRAAAEHVSPPPAGIEMDLAADLPLVNCDAAQLERAFANVLDNASRYAGDQPVSVHAQTGERWLTVRVDDRGPGLPKHELQRIFEPFISSGEGPPGGSGLGLAIARGFVEANDGRLRATSQPGQGASFIFQLPVPG